MIVLGGGGGEGGEIYLVQDCIIEGPCYFLSCLVLYCIVLYRLPHNHAAYWLATPKTKFVYLIE